MKKKGGQVQVQTARRCPGSNGLNNERITAFLHAPITRQPINTKLNVHIFMSGSTLAIYFIIHLY